MSVTCQQKIHKLNRLRVFNFDQLVGMREFEPPASTSRTWRSTRLSYTPICVAWFQELTERKGHFELLHFVTRWVTFAW